MALPVIKRDQDPNEPLFPSRSVRKMEMQARYERLWLLNPEQFNPLRNCMQRERLNRTWTLLHQHADLKDKLVADIGCAGGVFSRRLRDGGAKVIAVDIAENALKHIRKHDLTNIEVKQDAMPMTSLPDNAFDIVVCTDLIAELPPEDYRLFFSELSRLVKPKGYLVCSTPIDIYTEDGVHHLLDLAQTEFNTIDSIASYHALYLRIKSFFEIPCHYVAAAGDPHLRKKELEKRRFFGRGWFWFNTTPVLGYLWKGIDFLVKPVTMLLKNNRRILLVLEKICQFFWSTRGISHFIFIAQRRPVFVEEPVEVPIERPKKRQVWE